MTQAATPEIIAAFERAVLRPARAVLRSGHSSLEIAGESAVKDTTRQSIWIANHGGWLPMEIMFWALAGYEAFGPEALPRCVVHDVFYDAMQRTPGVRETIGAISVPAARLRNPDVLASWRHIAIFPEGADGNCKAWWRAYETQRFRSGFARLAALTGAQVIPCAIIGNDECTPVLATQRWAKPFVGSVMPLPMPLPPLPTNWKIVFHEPLEPPAPDASREELSAYAARAQALIQTTLDRETSGRRFANFARTVRSGRELLLAQASSVFGTR